MEGRGTHLIDLSDSSNFMPHLGCVFFLEFRVGHVRRVNPYHPYSTFENSDLALQVQVLWKCPTILQQFVPAMACCYLDNVFAIAVSSHATVLVVSLGCPFFLQRCIWRNILCSSGYEQPEYAAAYNISRVANLTVAVLTTTLYCWRLCVVLSGKLFSSRSNNSGVVPSRKSERGRSKHWSL